MAQQREKIKTLTAEIKPQDELYKQQTTVTSAIDWLVEKVNSDCLNSCFIQPTLIIQAKQMETEQNKVTQDTSDGYHTFKELYDFRMMYNAALFNEWTLQNKYEVHKSWKHNDGELCLGGGWFIVVAMLPTGQISNHYSAEHWDLFKILETETALFPFDGHTSQDVLSRLKNL